MPTAARLTAAIAFAIVGYFIFLTMIPEYGEDVVPRLLLPLCLVTGVVFGWKLCGTLAYTPSAGVGTGLTAVVAQVVFILGALALAKMLERSLRKRYDGPVEALIDMLALAFDDVLRFGTPQMGMVILVGGVVGGFVSGVMGKKFPH